MRKILRVVPVVINGKKCYLIQKKIWVFCFPCWFKTDEFLKATLKNTFYYETKDEAVNTIKMARV